MVILLKSPKHDVVTKKKKGFLPIKLQKVITSKNRNHLALGALNQKL